MSATVLWELQPLWKRWKLRQAPVPTCGMASRIQEAHNVARRRKTPVGGVDLSQEDHCAMYCTKTNGQTVVHLRHELA